jgi:molybdopterin adenylyltransferase
MEERIRAAVLTVSTRSSAGEREDTSGPALVGLAKKENWSVAHYSVIPDRKEVIASELEKICDGELADVVFTLGGTGLAPSDVTPEATGMVIEQTVPGISEAIRMNSLKKTDRAMLSRGVSGVRGRTLIINMPGSEKAVRESFDIVRPVIGHAVELIKGRVTDCGRTG